MKDKIFVAVPCLDTLETEFVKSLTAMNPVGECALNFSAGSLVFVSRDKLLSDAIMCESDYILWLDSDMVFSSDLLEKLYMDMQTGKDMMCALFFKRRPPYDSCIYKTIRMGLPGESVTEDYNDYPRDDVFEIDACGFGAVMMRTAMAKAIVDEFKTGFIPLPGYGEDISFCIRAKQLGYKIYCDSRIKVGHITRTVVDEATFEYTHGGNT